ncbi:MAG: hypothetical protein PUE18_04650 [Firmicutes bacterium]|nr:hypothetical protein [Bacillota bacterium]
MNKVGIKGRQNNHWYYELENGKYMFAVGIDGVNSTLIISNDDYLNPSIEKVYHINLDSESDIEIVRRYIYEEERLGALQGNDIAVLFGQELVSFYKSEDFPNYRESRREYERKQSERNSRNDSELQNRKRSNSKTTIKYSISKKVPYRLCLLSPHNSTLKGCHSPANIL